MLAYTELKKLRRQLTGIKLVQVIDVVYVHSALMRLYMFRNM